MKGLETEHPLDAAGITDATPATASWKVKKKKKHKARV